MSFFFFSLFFLSSIFSPSLILSHLLIISSPVPSGQIMKHQTDTYIWPCHVDICSASVRASACARVCACTCTCSVRSDAAMINCRAYRIYHSVTAHNRHGRAQTHSRTANTWREHVGLKLNWSWTRETNPNFQKPSAAESSKADCNFLCFFVSSRAAETLCGAPGIRMAYEQDTRCLPLWLFLKVFA